jgi:hypothetical protein
MINDYSKRLEQLRARRTDDVLHKAIVTESFSRAELGDSIKYTLESMREIDSSYTKNTYTAANNVSNNIKSGLGKVPIGVVFRTQGSVETNTHIKLHSDIDLLVILETFFTLERPQTPAFPYNGSPLDDLKQLRSETYKTLNSIYSQVDNSNAKAIKVFPTNPKRKVDVVSANWFNSNEYKNSGAQELYRGVQIYDKDAHTRSTDFPFIHISKVNAKDPNTNGGYKKLIRLLKTLREDADYKIDLNSFEITSLLFDISDYQLLFTEENQLQLLPVASEQLDKLITNDAYRLSLLSPNGKELVFPATNDKVVELKKMKREVDDLMTDIKKDLDTKFLSMDESILYK